LGVLKLWCELSFFYPALPDVDNGMIWLVLRYAPS
jgi:hypothetical protein